MAITWSDDITSINTCQSKGDWTGVNFSNPDDNTSGSATPVYREGTGCMQATAKVNTDGSWYDDITVNLTGKVLVWWVWFSGPTELAFMGDLLVALYSSTGQGGNYGRWNFLPRMQEQAVGGWFSAVVWPTQADESSGTPPISNVACISLEGFNTGLASDVKLVGWDYIHAVSYIQASGDTVTMEDFVVRDIDQDIGLWVQVGTSFASAGHIRIGASGPTTTWAEKSKALTFANANSDHTIGFQFIAGGLGDTNFTCGELSGGNPVNGMTITWTHPSVMYTDPGNTNIFKLYDTTHIGGGTVTLPTASVGREVLGCKFSDCGAISVSTCQFEDNTVVNAAGSGVIVPSTGRADKNNTYIGCLYGQEYTVAGTYTVDGDQFSGNTADIRFTAGSGTLTINAINGANPATSSATGTGTVVINNNKTLTLTNLVVNTEVRIYRTGTTTEEAGIENSTTSFEYGYSYPTGFNVDIVIHHVDYVYIRINNVILGDANASIPIQQQPDRSV